jgi:group I intron endonuclease
MGIIYLLTSPNGKVYVGQCKRHDRHGNVLSAAQQLHVRWLEHCRCSSGCYAVKHAIRKYGWQNFKQEVLTEKPDDELNAWERRFIRFYRSTQPKYGYNRTEGGEGGGFAIPEVRARMLQPGSKWMESHKRPGVTKRKQRNLHTAESMAKKEATFNRKLEERLAKLPWHKRDKARDKALLQREATRRWRTAHKGD